MKSTRFKPKWNNEHCLVSIVTIREYLKEPHRNRYYVSRWELVSSLSKNKDYKIFCDENNEPFKQDGRLRCYDKLVSILKD